MSLIPSVVVVVVVALLFLNVSVFFVFVTVPCVGLPLLFFVLFLVFFSKILPGVALFDGDGFDDYRGWLCMS